LWHVEAPEAGGMLATGPRAARNLLASGKLELGISRERVRQLQREAERALRMGLTRPTRARHVGRTR
jgi:hypothetical protein